MIPVVQPPIRSTRLRRAALVCAALLAACATTIPEGGRSAADDLSVPPPTVVSTPLRVFATGDTRGYLDTCGCEGGQMGGIPRRGTYLGAARRAGDLTIDLGNLTSGTGGIRDLRRDASFDALAAMRYDVLVPGRAEISDGPLFEDGVRRRGLRVLSANLRDEATGERVFPASWVQTLEDGRRVAVVGISESPKAKPDGRKVDLPVEALRTALRELDGKADAVIVATSLPSEAARALAVEVPGAALVLSGSTPEPDTAFERTPAGTLLGVAGHLGQYVSRVDFGADLRPAVTWRSWLDKRVDEDAAMAAIVRRYKDGAAALDLQMVEKIVAGHRDSGFAGSAACAPCHAEDHATWAESLHGRAMQILVDRKANRDPDCVPCHLVDTPRAGARLVADAMGVGCEACHGASAAHAANPSVRTPVQDGGRSACASRCHHPPEVKDFDFEAQWPRIAHGKSAPGPAAGSR